MHDRATCSERICSPAGWARNAHSVATKRSSEASIDVEIYAEDSCERSLRDNDVVQCMKCSLFALFRPEFCLKQSPPLCLTLSAERLFKNRNKFASGD